MNGSGIFSDREIKKAMETEQIVIDPFREEQLQSSSYDFCLGEYFWVTRDTTETRILSPYDEDSIKSVYEGPYKAVPHVEACEHAGLALFPGIPEDTPIIIIREKEFILCHTDEFMGIAHGGTTQIHAKSTTGRLNISVCRDAGKGDTGYINRWTLEVENIWNHKCFPLVVGQTIGQMSFFHMGETDVVYGNKGHYQSGTDLDEIKANWKPEQMLPRVQTL